MKYIELNNGLKVPILGSGTNTFGKVNNDYMEKLRGDSAEVDSAIEAGYRHFDSAQLYRNEEVLGEGLKKSKVSREEFFITTKLDTFEGFAGEEWAHEEIKKSLEKLQTDYVDLFLIHSPWDNDKEMVKAWSILEEYYDKGVFKAIGVSNFQEKDLDLILANCRIKPMVNQIESHVGSWNHELIQYNQGKDIATIAWGPVKGSRDNEELAKIGNKYGKSPVQTVLRYQIQRGVIVIPKSHDKAHQAESLDVFDFELSAEEMAVIEKL